MNERTGQWFEVDVGTYIRDRNSVAWRVQAKRGGQLLLVRPGAEPTTVQRRADLDPVTILEPTDAEAVELVKRELGGAVLSVQRRGGPCICPPLSRRLDEIHSHMFLMHGVWTKSGPGSRSADRILEFHREDHTDPAGPTGAGYIPHEHHADWETRSR